MVQLRLKRWLRVVLSIISKSRPSEKKQKLYALLANRLETECGISVNLTDKSYKAKSFEENKIVGKGKTKVITKKVTNSMKEDCGCNVNSKEAAVSTDEQQSAQASGDCPPGYMWELYNCRTETGIEWGEYFACMALVKKHSTCIALASYTEEVCDGECVPIA